MRMESKACEIMATISGKNPRRDQILQERIYDRLEAQYSRRIAFEISRAMKDAAKHIGEPMFLEDAMAEHRVRMAKRLEGLWSDSSTEMMEHINGQALKSYDVLNTPLANKIASDWLLSYGLKKITQIVDTTREDINSVIDRGIKDGLSEVEIASMIQSIAPMKSISRAATIARTEVVAASQNAAYQTASVIGVPMVKRWVSSGGERTRESHQIANGQVVGIHEKFRVGDSLLMHPGDPDGSAKEVINCRCACVYELQV